MSKLDSTAIEALIVQAGLTEVFDVYPEDVMVALEQAMKYNEAIAELDIDIDIPGATYLPGAEQ